MKKIILFIALVAALASCKEKFTGIDYTPPPVKYSDGVLFLDTQYTTAGVSDSFQRKILAEDFSGVQCANCPSAAKIIHDLDSLNPGKIVEIVMHPNSKGFGRLVLPYAESKNDFRTDDGAKLSDALGATAIGSLPEVALNRKHFSGEGQTVFSRFKLQAYFNNESSFKSKAAISFTAKTFDSATGKLAVIMQVQYGTAISDTDYFSVAITESNMKDLQEAPASVDSHYVHKNILRLYANPMNGVALTSATKGKTYILKYNATLPLAWKPSNLNIIGILHKHKPAIGNYYVTQVEESKLK